MAIIKVLKRKDGAALVVGVAVALVVGQFLGAVTTQLATKISTMGSGISVQNVGAGWRVSYLLPSVTLLLELLALEILIWIYVSLHESMKK